MNRELYSVAREYSVPLERLWKSWTDATELEQWYSPVALDVLPGSVTSEPYVGGLWTVAVDVPMNGLVAYFFGRYLLVEENDRLEHTLHYTQDADEFSARDETTPSHLITLDFEARGDGLSWVRFTQFGEMPEEQVELTRQGTESYFDNLELFLSR